MKKSEFKNIKAKSINDLKDKTHMLRIELVEIMVEKSLGKLKDVHKSRAKRKEIAQILTFLSQKKFESEKLKLHESADLKGKQNA